ncbi:MAG: hypothetical protein ACI4HO_03585 [Ruminococcus sp.]
MKLKKFTITFGIIFLAILGLLTYFSGTIDHMLLPQVKVCNIIFGDLQGYTNNDDVFLIAKSALVDEGNTGSIYVADGYGEFETTTVTEYMVEIMDSNEFYYQVKSKEISSSMLTVYNTSKEFQNRDRVFIVEEG